MLFEKYVESLNKLLKDRPETATMETIYSIDDEGNSYNKIYFEPSVGHHSQSDFETENVDEEDQEKTNAVCIN